MATPTPAITVKPDSKRDRGPLRVQLDVCIGQSGLDVGQLIYVKAGVREYTSFLYVDDWLTRPDRFTVSPELQLIREHQLRKAPSKDDTCFFLALGDTEPDDWGRRVIARAHAKVRKENPKAKSRALNAIDFLCAVDDFSRMGALRLRPPGGAFLRSVAEGKRATPPLVDLEKMYLASRAVERGKESAQDLKYLQGKGTSLGGMRPKCTVLDEDGTLALGKFPSIKDQRCVTRGEVLALRLAGLAGIEVPAARIVMVNATPVVVVTRFDRTADHGRIPYVSAASLLQAGRNDERAYTEVVDQMHTFCQAAAVDAQALWRRLVFNLLITNVDDHLHNLGFLHVGNGLWRLAPAFDLNPFPDMDRESKTWLTEDLGPVTSLQMLLDEAARFHVGQALAKRVVSEVHGAVTRWREVAARSGVGMSAAELEEFAAAFEHEEMDAAKQWLRLA